MTWDMAFRCASSARDVTARNITKQPNGKSFRIKCGPERRLRDPEINQGSRWCTEGVISIQIPLDCVILPDLPVSLSALKTSATALCWALLLLPLNVFAAERLPAPGELAAIFRPFLIEQVALSPDGHYLAYTLRENGRLSLVIAEIDRPANQTPLRVGEDATTGFFRRRVSIPATMTFLRWTEPTRLVYALSVPSPERREMRDDVRVYDVAKKEERKIVDSWDVAYLTFE